MNLAATEIAAKSKPTHWTAIVLFWFIERMCFEEIFVQN